MIDPISAAAVAEAMAGISAEMTGLTLQQAWKQQNMKDDGFGFGWNTKATTTPAITGDTSGSISTGAPNVTSVDAWHDYVENEQPQVSDTTGGIVDGSSSTAIVYSLLQKTDQSMNGVVPVGVPIDHTYIAVAQALGVSMDAAQMDVETKQAFANSIIAGGDLIYDKARGLVKAWWDGVNILFPRKTVEAVQNVIVDMGIGQGGGAQQTSEMTDYYGFELPEIPLSKVHTEGLWEGTSIVGTSVSTDKEYQISSYKYENESDANPPDLNIFSLEDLGPVITWTRKSTLRDGSEQISTFTASRNTYQISRTGQTVYRYVLSYGYASDSYSPMPAIIPNISGTFQAIMDTVVNGTISSGGYPDGTQESTANKYTAASIPSAGGIATSDKDTLDVVPINLPTNPDNTFESPDDPVDTPTDPDNVDDLPAPPFPLPIPDTKPSNPDVPLTDSSVINSTLINELVDELANTLDPQPGQSSGIIPVPPLPGITDPETGQTTFPSIIPESGPGFIHVYNPTPAEFVAFGSWLWVTYADATIDKILNNPFDGVIGAHELYATPNREGRDNIRSAFLTCPTTADLVPNRYSEIDCGTVIVPEFYGNYLDYSPYSQAYIYLPFIGINEVSIDDIVGHAVNIRYRVDSYSGACIAMIFVAKDGYQNLCYQFAGSCSVEVPMAGGSQSAIKAGMMQAEAYARAAMVSAGGHLLGGIGSALMGSLGGALSSVAGIAGDYANAKAGVEAARVANKSSVQHSGQFGASHGAMGQKIPFIIIRNPIQVKVVNYNDDYGYPAHKRVIIGGCTGYLRVREVNVISAHATDDEKAAIEALLKNGVYVS